MALVAKLIRFLCVFLSLILLASFSYAACATSPTYVEVFSGSNELGRFTSGASIYIHDNLQINPLKLDFYFESDEQSCYAEDSIKVKLFDGSSEVSANSVSEQGSNSSFVTLASFTFNPSLVVSNSFTTTYTVTNKNSGVGFGSLFFDVDNENPSFDVLNLVGSNLIAQGEGVLINYQVSDSGSGLESVVISGGTSEIVNFNNNEKSFSGSFNDTPSATTTYSFVVKDKLGNEATERLEVVVDNSGPEITNFDDTNYVFSSGVLRANFEVSVKDESFTSLSSSPQVIGDFSQLNPGKGSVLGSCSRSGEDTFSCNFRDIAISLEESKNVQVKFNSTDVVGNSREQSFTTNVFIDKQGPEVLEFFVRSLKNGVTKNIVSAVDDTTEVVVLKYRDDSIQEGYPLVSLDLGLIPFEPERTCNRVEKTVTCQWDLGTRVDVYRGFESYVDTYSVSLIDIFSNTNSASINVTYDNVGPTIDSVELIETDNIKDGIVQSGERIDFRVFLSGDNLEANGEFNVFADLSSIDSSNGANETKGVCSNFNESSVRCDFNSIKVINGYVNTSVEFTAFDVALNFAQRDFPIEIFKVSDEVVSSFKVSDLNIINPLNRNLILSSGGEAWYEGKIEKIGDNDMIIVNYQLAPCNDSEIDPLIVIPTTVELFPDAIVINRGQEDVDEFAMSFELAAHANINDLNDKSMSCSMSILKRDSDTVYAPEIVEFKVNIEFYDDKRGDLLTANAKSILDDIDDAEVLGSWFDTVFDVYETLDSICSATSTANGVVSGVTSAWTSISFLLRASGFGTPVAEAVDGPIYSTHAKVDRLANSETGAFGIVKRMCDHVTCRNYRLMAFKDEFGKLENLEQDMAGAVCGDWFEPTKTDKPLVSRGVEGLFGEDES